MQTLLQTSKLIKRYGSVTVLQDIDFELRGGEIHGLLGANGAGKSTFCKLVSGLTSVTQGEMSLRGKPFSPTSKQEAERAGIGIVQQELNQIPTLTVAENLFLNQLPNSLGVIRRSRLFSQARETLDAFGLKDVDARAELGTLGVGRQQMIEIAASLYRQCALLILDEPTAALSHAESQHLFEWLRELRSTGVGIIYVSHRLQEIADLTDRISIFRDGKRISTRPTRDTSTSEMVEIMSGDQRSNRDASNPAQSSTATTPTQQIALQVKNISRSPVNDVSFDVHRGEKLGIAGLVGSGRTELLRAIFGADIAEKGDVTVDSRVPRRFRCPSEAVQHGLAMVTEDRKQNGLFLSQSVKLNCTLSSLPRMSRWGVVRRREERQQAEQQCVALETKYQSIDHQTVQTLSGGNQQKVVIAKWLLKDARVFFFDEPTRGIDVTSRRQIYRLFDELVADGKALVIVSSDLEELLETCDRIGVMSAGKLVKTFTRAEFQEDAIMQAAFSEYVASEQP